MNDEEQVLSEQQVTEIGVTGFQQKIIYFFNGNSPFFALNGGASQGRPFPLVPPTLSH